MIKIIKPTRKEAKRAHKRITNYLYKSNIRPRLIIIPLSIEWWFKYIPIDDIDQDILDKLARLNRLNEGWNIMIRDLIKLN